jgi:hypothetical protein
MKKLSIVLAVILVCSALVSFSACSDKQNQIEGTYYYIPAEKDIETLLTYMTPEECDKYIEDMKNECFFQIDNDNFTLQIPQEATDESVAALSLKGTYTLKGNTISLLIDDDSFEEYYNTLPKTDSFSPLVSEEMKERAKEHMNQKLTISGNYKTLTDEQKNVFKKR